MFKNLIIASLSLLLCNTLNAAYTYEADKDLYDLTNQTGTTNLAVGDDQVSAKFNFGFDFTYYGNTFTFARMATNGCIHFGLNSTSYNDYCGDYTPDPLPQYTNTLFPFWTDLIRDNGSKMLAKNILNSNNEDLYTIFGWYNLREYNRSNTDNSFEVWLYPNNTFEYRYGALNIVQHDVLIGEQGPTTSDIYQYYFHDECSTGTTNTSSCVNQSWNQSTMNTTLESGGSLSGVGTGNALDCSNPLNNEACSGYAAAYLAQQCGLDSLYSTSCPLYWDAYDDQQCAEDPQYAPFCAGYTQEASVAYFDPNEFDYGYDEADQYGYEEDYYWEDEYYSDNCINDPSYCYDDDPYAGEYLTDSEWYEIDLQEFGQEQVDDWYGTDVAFTEEGWIEWDSSPLDTWDELDYQMDVYDNFMETSYPEEEYIEIFDVEELTELYEFDTIIREELTYEEENYVEFETMEELDEWFEEEMEEISEYDESQQVAESSEDGYAEEEIFEEEAVEEIYEDLEEEWIAETEEEVTTPLEESEELEIVGSSIDREERSSMNMETALNVVANTVQAAANSVSGTTSGTSIHATGNTTASGGTSTNTGTASAVASSSSSGGFSTSSSPSMSDQFASASVQTNTVLSMSADTGAVSNVTTVTTPMPTTEVSVEVAAVETQVQDMQGQIDTAMSEMTTPSEADQIADQIVAQNLKAQQEEVQSTQESTGEYADQSVFVAYLGYNAGFTDYYDRSIPRKEDWYEPKAIYADAYLSDNTRAFYQLAGDSLTTIQNLRNLQPTL